MAINERELFELINESGDPEQAVLIAIRVFASFLEQLGEAPMLQADDLSV